MHLSHELMPYNKISSTVVGTIVYPPGGRHGPRIQQDVQLVLLHTGSMVVHVDGNPNVVKPGHVVLLKPGHHEYFEFADDQETWHRWIAIHCIGLTGEERSAIENLPFCIPIPEELNRLTDILLTLRSDYTKESGVMCSLGHAVLNLYASELTRTKLLKEIHPSVVMAKNIIHNDCAEEITLADLARGASVSPEHLVRLFHTFEATTPIKYLWHYRVLRAVELLTHTGLTITEVTERCGFKTTFHFARTIKKQTGSTPTEIRKSSWEGIKKP